MRVGDIIVGGSSPCVLVMPRVLLMKMDAPFEARERTVPDWVIWEPGKRVWESRTKAEFELAVRVVEPRTSVAGVWEAGVCCAWVFGTCGSVAAEDEDAGSCAGTATDWGTGSVAELLGAATKLAALEVCWTGFDVIVGVCGTGVEPATAGLVITATGVIMGADVNGTSSAPPGVRVYGGSKKACIPGTQEVYEGLMDKIFVGTERSGEHGLYTIV